MDTVGHAVQFLDPVTVYLATVVNSTVTIAFPTERAELRLELPARIIQEKTMD